MIAQDSIIQDLVSSLGESSFNSQILNCMRSLAHVSHVSLVHYSRGQVTPIMASGHSVEQNDVRELSPAYVNRLYEIDPLYQQANVGSRFCESEVFRVANKDVRDLTYRREIYERFDVVDRAAILVPDNDTFYCLNLYRHAQIGAFEEEVFGNIRKWEPILSTLVRKHAQLLDQNETPSFKISSVSQRLQQICANVLTDREIEVCARIICGYSSLAISLDLGVSVNTVYTHRRHAYEKLGIGTQNMLFSILYENRLPFAS